MVVKVAAALIVGLKELMLTISTDQSPS